VDQDHAPKTLPLIGIPSDLVHVREVPLAPRELEVTSAEPVRDWLLREGPGFGSITELAAALCGRLVADGLPLARVTMHIGTLHPLYLGTGVRWYRTHDTIDEMLVTHQVRQSTFYTLSPMRAVFEQGETVRIRIPAVATEGEYPILADLRGEGMTDYLALPLPSTIGRRNGATFATDRPGGFSEADLARIDGMLPALALVFEMLAMRRIGTNLMNVYLGRQAGARVLDGQILRGHGETMRAVILQADLRSFTRLSDTLPGADVIAALNAYFERMVTPVHARGGEVLKFIGDGLLAIFPVRDDGTAAAACAAALDATQEGLRAMDRLNADRAALGAPELEAVVALHFGDVIFGNIGAEDRLDFTVIGPAVNVASRLEKLTRPLDRRVLASGDFAAAAADRPLVSLGFHPIRGLREPLEVFGLQ